MIDQTIKRVLISKADYARHRNCKPPYISKLCREGKIVEVDGLIDRDASDIALANVADPSKAAVIASNAKRYGKVPRIPAAAPFSSTREGSDGSVIVGSYAEAKRDRERALADRCQWDLQVEKQLYVSRDIASQLAFQAGRSWRDQLTEVQNTLPTGIIAIIKQHLPTSPGDEILKIQHAVAEAVLAAHRSALANVAQQVNDLAASRDAASN